MKHTLKLFLICLLPLLSFGQITITLPKNVVTEARLKSFGDSLVKALGKEVVVPPIVVPDIPVLRNCKEGPQVKKISNVTPTSLLLQFHGEEVTKLQVEIYNLSGLKVAQQSFSPSGNQLAVTYTPLPAGKYRLLVRGLNCNGQDDKEFTIADSGTGVIVPPVTIPGEKVTVAKGMDEHMQLDWRKDGDGYVISDLASPDQIGYFQETIDGIIYNRPYEYRYLIGAEIVKTGRETLKNYRIDGVNPTRVIKYKIKPNLATLNHWTSDPTQVGGYYELDAAESFTKNTSVAYETVSFPDAQGDFINPIPANFDPSKQNVHWADIVPDMKLPKGHFYIESPKNFGIENVKAKGVTHISNYKLPWSDGPPYSEVVRLMDAGDTYDDVPRIETKFKLTKQGSNDYTNGWNKAWWRNGPLGREEAIQKSWEMDINHAIQIGETEENEAFLPNDVPMWGYVYPIIKERNEERYTKRGIPYLNAHNYYHLWPSAYNLEQGPGKLYYKNLLKLEPNKMPASVYLPGGVLSATNLILEGVYLGAPDIVTDQPLKALFHYKVAKHLGYKTGSFLADVQEWNPNNRQLINFPDGKYYIQQKLPLDPAILVANGFQSQVHGNIYVQWGGGEKVRKKTFKTTPGTTWAESLWYPTGSTSPQGGFPHTFQNGDDEYYGYNGGTELGYFSQKLYVDSYAHVEGGVDQYLKFRIDGGAWVNAQEEDFIDAFHEKRGFVHSRSKGGKIALYYLNCYADNRFHTLEVELPDGRKWTGRVSGNGVHVKLL